MTENEIIKKFNGDIVVDKVKSEEILNEFIESGEDIVHINVEATKRSLVGLYTGLRNYIKNHGIDDKFWVVRQGNTVILYKRSENGDRDGVIDTEED